MPEKFFDIIPPGEKGNKGTEIIAPERSSLPLEPAPVVEKKKRYLLKSIIGLVIFLVVISFITSFFMAKAEVNIWPETGEMNLSETIIVDLNVTEINLEEKIIPAQITDNEKSGSQEFSATGKTTTEGKSSGMITVYNAYSTSSRTLIPSRFVSADGKLFRSVEKIKVPGYTTVKGKIVPGEKQVKVEAAETGSDYNIESTTFALPALAGTALYTTIYARSFDSMTGGHKGEVKQVTKEDLEKAEDTIVKRLKEESIALLKSSLSENLILPEETVIQEVTSFESSHSVGSGVDSFTVESTIGSKGVVFKKSDIDKFVKKMIEDNIDSGQIVREDVLETNYTLEDIDLEEGMMVINLGVKAITYKDIDLEKLKESIMGKRIGDAEILLNGLAGIDKVELKCWPFIKRTIPDMPNKVEIELKFE